LRARAVSVAMTPAETGCLLVRNDHYPYTLVSPNVGVTHPDIACTPQLLLRCAKIGDSRRSELSVPQHAPGGKRTAGMYRYLPDRQEPSTTVVDRS
jgi:hypothetical protein